MRAAGQSSETKKCSSRPEGDLIKITKPQYLSACEKLARQKTCGLFHVVLHICSDFACGDLSTIETGWLLR